MHACSNSQFVKFDFKLQSALITPSHLVQADVKTLANLMQNETAYARPQLSYNSINFICIFVQP